MCSTLDDGPTLNHGRTAIKMSHRPPVSPVRSASQESRVRFNWPLTDDELAQHRPYSPESSERNPEFRAAETQRREPFPVDRSPATDALILFPSEKDAGGLPVIPPATSQAPSGLGLDMRGARTAPLIALPEPLRAAAAPPQSRTPGDGAQTSDDGWDLPHARTEAVSTCVIAVSPSTNALDLPGPRDLADEVAHLQALIGELTKPIEWRIPT